MEHAARWESEHKSKIYALACWSSISCHLHHHGVYIFCSSIILILSQFLFYNPVAIALKIMNDSSFVYVPPESLSDMKGRLPTKDWRERIAKGMWHVSSDIIDETEKILQSFLKAIEKTDKDPKTTLKAFAMSICELNVLNTMNGHFIETIEREELADFYNEVANVIEFKNPPEIVEFAIDDPDDVTLIWRMW